MQDSYLDAQRAIIGSLIIAPEKCADDIFATVKPHHFSDEGFRQLFEKAHELHSRGVIDQLVLQHKTPRYIGLITDIVANTPTAANYREYMEVLLTEYRLAQTMSMYRKIEDMRNCGDIHGIAQAIDELWQLFHEQPGGIHPTELGDAFTDFLDRMDKAPEYVALGWKKMDRGLFMEKGDMVVIGARPSVGKTAFALNIADEISKKYKAIFFSLETSESKLGDRYFSNTLDTSLRKIKNRELSDEEKGELTLKWINIKDRRLYFQESGGWKAEEICDIALKEKAEVIFVDYLSLVPGEGRSDYEKVSSVSKYFHTFAQKHKIMVVLLSQLNREAVKNERPDISNLRDSGQVEQDADVIMLLHQPIENDPLREVIIAKNKDGETGSFALDFDGEHQRFFESDRADTALRECKSKEGRKTLSPMSEIKSPREKRMAQMAFQQ